MIEHIDLCQQLETSDCGIKFAFELPITHVANHYEEYGYEDWADLLVAHTDLMPRTDVGLHSTDGAGAKMVVVLEAYCTPQDFPAVRQAALDWLVTVHQQPRYSTGQHAVNHALAYAEEHGAAMGLTPQDTLPMAELIRRVYGHEFRKCS